MVMVFWYLLHLFTKFVIPQLVNNEPQEIWDRLRRLQVLHLTSIELHGGFSWRFSYYKLRYFVFKISFVIINFRVCLKVSYIKFWLDSILKNKWNKTHGSIYKMLFLNNHLLLFTKYICKQTIFLGIFNKEYISVFLRTISLLKR